MNFLLKILTLLIGPLIEAIFGKLKEEEAEKAKSELEAMKQHIKTIEDSLKLEDEIKDKQAEVKPSDWDKGTPI
jgi:hypothetical protein